MSRHPGTEHLLKYFNFDHLPEGRPREISSVICHLAHWLAGDPGTDYKPAGLPDSPELTAGLRKLLEAKDCFVRAALDTKEE
ncbi:MAG: hypothetical protein QM753_06825 [Thermomicrobiales bacterium]